MFKKIIIALSFSVIFALSTCFVGCSAISAKIDTKNVLPSNAFITDNTDSGIASLKNELINNAFIVKNNEADSATNVKLFGNYVNLGGSLQENYQEIIANKNENAEITFPVSGYDIGKDVGFVVNVYICGSGYEDCGYSPIGFFTVENYCIDDALPTEEWVMITGQTKVLFDGNQTFIKIIVKNGDGETVRISEDVSFFSDTVKSRMFGGTTVYMLPCIEAEQNTSFVIETAAGSVIVYDGGNVGDAEYLTDFIYGIKSEVDAWFISHYHGDHVGALSVILKKDYITVKNLYCDFPSDEELASHPEDYPRDYWTLKENLNKAENVIRTHEDMKIVIDEVTFTALNNETDFGGNYGNNTTIVFKMDTPGESILFLGDAGVQLGNWLLANKLEEITSCSIVQAAHHGQNGTDRNFYATISPKVWLICAPEWLWYGKYGNEKFFTYPSAGPAMAASRTWMRELNAVKKYITKDGLIKLI